MNVHGNTLAFNVTNGVGGLGTLNVNSANTITLSGALTDGAAGEMALTASGTGTTILTSASNAYGEDGTTISNGTIRAGVANVISSTSALLVGKTGTFDSNNLNQNVGSDFDYRWRGVARSGSAPYDPDHRK